MHRENSRSKQGGRRSTWCSCTCATISEIDGSLRSKATIADVVPAPLAGERPRRPADFERWDEGLCCVTPPASGLDSTLASESISSLAGAAQSASRCCGSSILTIKLCGLMGDASLASAPTHESVGSDAEDCCCACLPHCIRRGEIACARTSRWSRGQWHMQRDAWAV